MRKKGPRRWSSKYLFTSALWTQVLKEATALGAARESSYAPFPKSLPGQIAVCRVGKCEWRTSSIAWFPSADRLSPNPLETIPPQIPSLKNYEVELFFMLLPYC